MVELKPSVSTTEQVKVTPLPGHTGGGDVKLLSVVAAPVQTDKGKKSSDV